MRVTFEHSPSGFRGCLTPSSIDDIIPKLVGESILQLIQRPALTTANLCELLLELNDLALGCCFLHVLFYRLVTDLQTLPSGSRTDPRWRMCSPLFRPMRANFQLSTVHFITRPDICHLSLELFPLLWYRIGNGKDLDAGGAAIGTTLRRHGHITTTHDPELEGQAHRGPGILGFCVDQFDDVPPHALYD